MSYIGIEDGFLLNENVIKESIAAILECDDLAKDHYKIEWRGTGVDLRSPEAAADAMLELKQKYNKTEGNQAVFMTIILDEWQSAHHYETNQCIARVIASDVSQLIFEWGYQNMFFLERKDNSVGITFIINSTSFCGGTDLTYMPWFIQNIKVHLDTYYRFLNWDRYIAYSAN